eukprot:03921.XXX_9106_9340_1 [CDS] Oithona nana genome sequencing.
MYLKTIIHERANSGLVNQEGQRKYNYSNSFVATTSNIKFFNIAKMIDDDA